MVGSYSSTKWFWMSWMVRADLPTPPSPTTTSLYSVILSSVEDAVLSSFIHTPFLSRGRRLRRTRLARQQCAQLPADAYTQPCLAPRARVLMS